jgi:hypothetical protein
MRNAERAVADFEKSGMAAKRIDGVKIDTLEGRMPGRTPGVGGGRGFGGDLIRPEPSLPVGSAKIAFGSGSGKQGNRHGKHGMGLTARSIHGLLDLPSISFHPPGETAKGKT